MPFLWWLVIISAVVLVLSFFFGRAPAGNVRAEEGAQPPGGGPDRALPVPPDDRPDAVHIKRNHAHEFAEEVSPFSADGTAKVSEEPELFPDRTGTEVAEMLGATRKPQDTAKDKRSDEAAGEAGAGAPGTGPWPTGDSPDPGTRGWEAAEAYTRRLAEQGRLAPSRVEAGPPMQGPMIDGGTHGFGAWTPPVPGPVPGNEEQSYRAATGEGRQP